MKPKTYIQIAIAILVIGYVISSQYSIKKLREQIRPDNTETELANTISETADNQAELIDSLNTQIAMLKKKLEDEFDNENFQPVNITIDEPIPDVNTYIDYDPDWSPELEDIFTFDNRIAEYTYHYTDTSNEYSAEFAIKYEYRTQLFTITPSELTFEPEKVYPFCLSACILSNAYGLNLSYDFLYRFRVGSSVLLTKKVEPVLGVNIGFRF